MSSTPAPTPPPVWVPAPNAPAMLQNAPVSALTGAYQIAMSHTTAGGVTNLVVSITGVPNSVAVLTASFNFPSTSDAEAFALGTLSAWEDIMNALPGA